MQHFIYDYFELVLCFLILLARLADITSTYLVTPTLKLEGNLLARKLGWRFALLTILVCLVPFYSTSMGIVVLVPSLFVSASNIGKIWLVRSMGEKQFSELIDSIARRQKLSPAIAGVVASSLFIILAGLVLLYLSPDPSTDWGYWYAVGIIAYGLAIMLHGSLYYWRLFKKARKTENNSSQSLS